MPSYIVCIGLYFDINNDANISFGIDITYITLHVRAYTEPAERALHNELTELDK